MTTKKTTTPPIFTNKHQLLLYSLFISFASISLYVSINGIYDTYQGYIWSYHTSYIINAAMTTSVTFVTGLLFLYACIRMIKHKKYSIHPAILSALLLISYPLIILFYGTQMPTAFDHLTILLLPTILLLAIIISFWKKYEQ